MNDVDVLEAAAGHLHDLADDVTGDTTGNDPGWTYTEDITPSQDGRVDSRHYSIAAVISGTDGRFIALLDPVFARLTAETLRQTAYGLANRGVTARLRPDERAAIALARHIVAKAGLAPTAEGSR